MKFINKKTGAIATSVAAIAVCTSIIAGSTFALFTSETKTDIAITSAKVDVTATIGEITATGLNGKAMVDAKVEGGNVSLDNIAPGDKVSFDITVENKSTIQVQYRTKIACTEGAALMSALVFNVGEKDYSGLVSYVSEWSSWDEAGSYVIPVEIALPEAAGNIYQELSCKVSYAVEAVQGNGDTVDESELVKNSKFDVYNADEFRIAMHSVVEDGVVNVMDDITLTKGISVLSKNVTLNGNNHTITLDMGINDQALIFGAGGNYDAGNVTVKDLTVEGSAYAGIWVSHYSTDKAGVNTVLENVTVTGEYQFAAVGFTNNTGATLKNCRIENNLPDSQALYYSSGIGAMGVFSSNYLPGYMTLENTTVDTWFVNNPSTKEAKVRVESGSTIHAFLTEVANAEGKICTVGENGTVDYFVLCKSGSLPKVQGGEFDGAYAICSADYLADLAKSVNLGNNYSGKTVVLLNDIDLKNRAWTPIGNTNANCFSGIFNGNNHTVSNLNVNVDGDFAGLFGIMKNNGTSPELKNVTVHNATVFGVAQVGALIGDAYQGKINNCHVSGLIDVSGNYHVGGLFGYGYASFNNCSVIGDEGSTVTGIYKQNNLEGDAIGGLVGYAPEVSVTYGNFTVSGLTVSGTRKVGGLIGQAGTYTRLVENVTVENVTVNTNASEEYLNDNTGKIYLGGVVGEVTGDGSAAQFTVTGTASNIVVNGVAEANTGAVVGGTRSSKITIVSDGVVTSNITVNY